MKIFVSVFMVFLAAVMGTGEALKCYECLPEDPKCNNPVDHEDLIKDDAEYTTCFKAALNIENQTYTARGGQKFVSPLPHACDNVTIGEIKEFIRASNEEPSETLDKIDSLLANGKITEDESVNICTCSTEFCNDNTITKGAKTPRRRFWRKLWRTIKWLFCRFWRC